MVLFSSQTEWSPLLAQSALPWLPIAAFAHYFFGILLSLIAIFLILLILIQRGRGGGLAGAFGGMGGQSAFGTKAGDTFTRVTIVVAIIWILICVASVRNLSTSTGAFGQANPSGETEIDQRLPGNLPNSTTQPNSTAPAGPNAPADPAAPASSAAPATGVSEPTATPAAAPSSSDTPAATETAPPTTQP